MAGALIGALSASAGAAAFTVATVSTGHTGSIPSAGPASISSSGPGGGGQRTGGQGNAQTTQPSGTTPNPGGGQGGQVSTSNTELITLLNATSTRWSAAVIGDQSAAGYILATNTSVMAIGGWGGSDNAPTLTQFQEYVKDGTISYFIAGSGTGGGGNRAGSDSSATQITTWVEANYTATTVGDATVYDLTS